MKEQEIVEVIPNLYLSSLQSVEQLFSLNLLHKEVGDSFELRSSVKHIISIGCQLTDDCLSNIPVDVSILSFPEIQDNPEHYILPLCDVLRLRLREYLDNEQNTIVHCVYGQSRSVAVILFYLICLSSCYSLSSAYEYIRSRRPSICVNPGFLTQLALFEQFYQRITKATGPAVDDISSADESNVHNMDEIGLKRGLSAELGSNDQYELIMKGLQESYPEGSSYKSLSIFRAQVPDGKLFFNQSSTTSSHSSGWIYCKFCHSSITALSNNFHPSSEFFELQSTVDCLTDEFWQSYFPLTCPPSKEFIDLIANSTLEESRHPSKRRKPNDSIVSANKKQGNNKYDLKQFFKSFTSEEIYRRLEEHYYILVGSNLPLLPSKESPTLSCCNCHNALGKRFQKSFPIIGKYCLIDVTLINKDQCFLREVINS